ncbi:MAG: hypothetical protein HY043_23135 [Verrucomicrobia bacterium]|nr:hypothetical protein [Verrucomicrobiota bacterium]
MKRYEGKRSYGQCFVTVNGCALDPRFDLRFHSPDGFEWGYGGSGPAQLALALLADHLANAEQALALYQSFKFKVIAGLPREGWTLTSQEIEQALQNLREMQPHLEGVP